MAAAPRSVFSVRASARRPPRPLAVAILGLAAFVPPGMGPRAAGDAADVPYTSGDEIAFTEQARVALGTGPACCVGLDGDLLVVGTARWSMGQPADDPRLALADDPFMIHDPRPRWTTDSGATVFELAAAGPRRLASLPTRFAPVAIAFNGPARARPNDRPARIYVADPQYVTCFEREGDRFTRRWLHQADGIRRLVFEAPDRLYVLTATGFERLQDGRDAALPLHAHVAAVSDVFPQRNTALVCSPRGDVDLLEFENGGVVRALGTVRLLGPARLARGIVGSRCLLLADRGLEQAELRDIMAAWPGRPAFFDMLETTSLGKRDRGRLGKVGVERPAEVEDLLPLGEKRAWLRYADGTVWETQLDAAGKRVEKPRRLEGLDGITAIAGDAERQAVVDRAGRVRLLAAAGSVGEPLPLVEAGPWIAAGDAVFVASGPRLHRFDRNRGLGDVVLDLGGGYLRDIGRDGDQITGGDRRQVGDDIHLARTERHDRRGLVGLGGAERGTVREADHGSHGDPTADRLDGVTDPDRGHADRRAPHGDRNTHGVGELLVGGGRVQDRVVDPRRQRGPPDRPVGVAHGSRSPARSRSEVSGRAPRCEMTSAAAIEPSRPHTSSGSPVLNPWRNPAA